MSLDGAYESLRVVAETLNGFELYVERSGLLVPKVSDAPLPDGGRRGRRRLSPTAEQVPDRLLS